MTFVYLCAKRVQALVNFIKKWQYCLGNIEKKTFVKTAQHKSPMFFSNMRGSCLGIHFQDKEETWFLCHYVVFDTKRYYYHCMVVLNNNDYSIKNFQLPFQRRFGLLPKIVQFPECGICDRDSTLNICGSAGVFGDFSP